MRTTINLPPKVLEAAKTQARENKTTLSAYVESAVRSALERDSQVAETMVPIALPVFDLGGPALVDLDDKDALWEALDADS